LFAIFNPDRAQPPGGYCVSVFVIVKRNHPDPSILVGKIAEPNYWEAEWGLDLKHPERWEGKWQIPATFLKVGEHPDSAALNVCKSQIGLHEGANPSNPRFFTSGGPSSVRPGTNHEDLFFVYDVEVGEELLKPTHFSELHFVETKRLNELQFGRGHDEVLHLCKIY
jgi:ADP-ribose pyrophosphatase YjhB (NUDIX family)